MENGIISCDLNTGNFHEEKGIGVWPQILKKKGTPKGPYHFIVFGDNIQGKGLDTYCKKFMNVFPKSSVLRSER